MSGALLQWLGENRFEGLDGAGHIVAVSTSTSDDGAGFEPTDLLLIALAGCASVEVVRILQKQRQGLTSLRVEVRGEQETAPPHAFRTMTMHFRAQGKALTEAGLRRAIDLSEQKYCSVAASLRPRVKIRTSFEIVPAGGP